MPALSAATGSTACPATTSLNRASNLRSVPDERGDPAVSATVTTEKFPDFDAGSGVVNGLGNGGTGNPQWHAGNVTVDADPQLSEKWMPHRDSRVKWAAPADQAKADAYGHRKQPSFASAIRHLRTGSVSQNAHEIADALRAPISWNLIFFCLAWYGSSAMTNTSSKSILTAFDKPATLTLVQFALVAVYCLLLSWLASVYPRLRDHVPALKHPIRSPSRDVITTTFPLAAFQIAGHLLSAAATSKMPVSLVHTIKGLSPLFTVLAYRFIYDIRYPKATYFSLVPLTVGVMLACSGKHALKGEFVGITCSLLATFVFVTSNIFSKKLFNEAARAEEAGLATNWRRLDKLNLLCYSSGLAFILTMPIWLWSEGIDILGDFLWDGSVDLVQAPHSFDHGRLTMEFIFNGTFHFGQNILAFVLLSKVSPVTYSVASLLKRVFVIIVAILWFQSPTTKLQGIGIALTFLGLYLYDRSSEKNKADQRARNLTVSKGSQPLLPLSLGQALAISQNTVAVESPVGLGQTTYAYAHGHSLSLGGDDSKKTDDGGREHARGTSHSSWLPPGTKQEATWQSRKA